MHVAQLQSDEAFWKLVVFQMRVVSARSPINRQNGNHLFRFVSTEFDFGFADAVATGCCCRCGCCCCYCLSAVYVNLVALIHSASVTETHSDEANEKNEYSLHHIYLAMACSNKCHWTSHEQHTAHTNNVMQKLCSDYSMKQKKKKHTHRKWQTVKERVRSTKAKE